MQDGLALEPIESVTVTTLVDNMSDLLLMDEGPAKRPGLAKGAIATTAARFFQGGRTIDPLSADHGFAALVTVRIEGRERRVLYDTGIAPEGLVENMRRLDIEPATIEAVVLSHGHFDHTAGLHGLARVIGRAKLPIVLHPDCWVPRRIAIPGREPVGLPVLSRAALEEAGFRIRETREPSLLLDGRLLVTGEVERTTEFEQGFFLHQALRDGDWVPDPLILDDQALVLHVQGKGLVVLTGCSHAGIVNIVRQARKLTGVDRIHAIIGGLHLGGPLFESIIPPTCDALREIAPAVLVPTHCTGWRAVHALAASLPEAFIQNSVGTRIEL